MKVSHIMMQQSLLTLNNRKNCEQIGKEIQARNSVQINQVSLFNSNLNISQFPILPTNIEILVIRKCAANFISKALTIYGVNLKSVEVPYCNLKIMPVIKSCCLGKLNVSNNFIEEIVDIPNKTTLKLLDIRNNHIAKITKEVYYLPTLTILHQFINNKLHTFHKQKLPFDVIIDINSIIKEQLIVWESAKLIQICEEIIENDNQVLLSQILSFLSQQFISKIFQIAKNKRKLSILQLLVSLQFYNNATLDISDRVMLLIPKLLPFNLFKFISLELIVKCLSSSGTERKRVLAFLAYIQSNQSYLFIQSEKDIIGYMSLNSRYSNSFQIQFLLTQLNFFKKYDFSNINVIKYLLTFDNTTMLNLLLSTQGFNSKMFSQGLYRSLVRPNKKIYKLLQKRDRQYKRELMGNSNWYFPQYRERKSFCLKNDLYDYEILKEYQEMQCSYMKKDFKYTFKFCNKQNQISIAKRIGNQLKKQKYKNIKQSFTQYSTTPKSNNKQTTTFNVTMFNSVI